MSSQEEGVCAVSGEQGDSTGEPEPGPHWRAQGSQGTVPTQEHTELNFLPFSNSTLHINLGHCHT